MFLRYSINKIRDEIANDKSFLSLLGQTEWHIDTLNLSNVTTTSDATFEDEEVTPVPVTVKEIIPWKNNKV